MAKCCATKTSVLPEGLQVLHGVCWHPTYYIYTSFQGLQIRLFPSLCITTILAWYRNTLGCCSGYARNLL